MRFLLNLFWPISITGEQHLPRRGPAILIANHASYLDPIVLFCITRQKPRFFVWAGHYQTPMIGWIYRLIRATPVDIL